MGTERTVVLLFGCDEDATRVGVWWLRSKRVETVVVIFLVFFIYHHIIIILSHE